MTTAVIHKIVLVLELVVSCRPQSWRYIALLTKVYTLPYKRYEQSSLSFPVVNCISYSTGQSNLVPLPCKSHTSSEASIHQRHTYRYKCCVAKEKCRLSTTRITSKYATLCKEVPKRMQKKTSTDHYSSKERTLQLIKALCIRVDPCPRLCLQNLVHAQGTQCDRER